MNDSLPAVPAPAEKYMSQKAGTSPSLSGPGSQIAGTGSSGTTTAGNGLWD